MRLHRIPGGTQRRRKTSPLIIIIIIVTPANLCVDFEVIQPQLRANSALSQQVGQGVGELSRRQAGGPTRCESGEETLPGSGVQIYPACFGERNRACRHPQAVSHLLPTYINSSES